MFAANKTTTVPHQLKWERALLPVVTSFRTARREAQITSFALSTRSRAWVLRQAGRGLALLVLGLGVRAVREQIFDDGRPCRAAGAAANLPLRRSGVHRGHRVESGAADRDDEARPRRRRRLARRARPARVAGVAAFASLLRSTAITPWYPLAAASWIGSQPSGRRARGGAPAVPAAAARRSSARATAVWPPAAA